MVLAHYSGTLVGVKQPEQQRPARHPRATVGVVSALALCCFAAVTVFSAQGQGSVALVGTSDLAAAALNAEQTLDASIAKLGRGAQTLQKTSLGAEMNQALSAVQELKGKLPSIDAAADAAYASPDAAHLTGVSTLKAGAAKGGRGRSRLQAKAAAHADAQDLVHKSLAKVRIAAHHAKTDSDITGDLATSDNALVRNELRKMVEVAKRLSGEMKAMPTTAAQRVAERVQRKLGAVSHAATAMKKAAGEEDAARRRVVAHELEVRKQKLAEAEEEELAAQRAAQEAIADERLAVEKHKEAAADEAAAHQRRVAARRARAIAARGQEGKGPSTHADEAADSVFGKAVLKDEQEGKNVHTELDKYAPTTAQVARECTDTIATYGCGGLMASNPCLAYCGTDNAVRRAAKKSRTPSYAVHDRSGYFATGKDRDTYVDSVYGDKYDSSTYAHERNGFFVKKSPRSSLLAPQVSAGGFSDEAADGKDYHDEQSSENLGSTQQVLRNEEQMKRRLQGSLAQEQAQNKQLQQRLMQQESANRDLSSSLSYVSGIPLDSRGVGQSVDVLPKTPPLPGYKAVTGSEELAQVDTLHRSVAGVLLHNPSDSVNTAQNMHDPYRP